MAVNIQTGEELAVKLENAKSKHPQLMYEAKLLKHLNYTRVFVVEQEGGDLGRKIGEDMPNAMVHFFTN